MITYHEFMFPIEPKYLPMLKVSRQPFARINYKAVNGVIEILETGFHPMILIHIYSKTDFIAEIEAAAKEHYNDEKPDTNLKQEKKAFV